MKTATRSVGLHGFSVIELLVGILAASIFVLTVGAVLVSQYLSWRRSQALLELQRDGTVVMRAVARNVRGASSSDITVGASQVYIQTTNKMVHFYTSGNSLMYDPDVDTPDDEFVLVGGKVQSFSVTNMSSSLFVSLALQDGSENTTVRTALAYRN